MRGLLADADPISANDLSTARSVRAGLRDAIATRASPDLAASAVGEFTVLARVPLDVAIDLHGWPTLRPRPRGVRGGLGLVLIEAVTASATRRWTRLKMCGAPDCRWVFFDASKPGTARWCETDICGNRMKKTNQRARRRLSDGLGPRDRRLR